MFDFWNWDIFDFWKDWKYKSTGRRVWVLILTGLIGAPMLYVAAILLEFWACFFSCGNACRDYDGEPHCALPIWTPANFGYTFLFLSIAGIIIGIIYAIAVGTQEARDNLKDTIERETKNRKQSISSASSTVGNTKSKSDKIVSLIKTAEKTIVSTRARKILEEAAIVANTSALAMEEADKISKKAIGKTSKWASKNAQHAEDVSRLLEKDVDTAYDLYNQATREEGDWNRIQQEARDAEKNAKDAKDDAEKEVATVEKMVFVSATAKDAADKAIYALSKAKDAAAETVKRADAVARATSAQNAQIEVFQVKYSEKRALVERKIAVEEAEIAIEAEKQIKNDKNREKKKTHPFFSANS
jgi:hypothetical protein